MVILIILPIPNSNHLGVIPLHLAAQYDHFDVAKIIIQNDGYANIREKEGGMTPLHIAAINKNENVYRLIDKGFEKYPRNCFGFTPADYL